jgi:hypothetical protein
MLRAASLNCAAAMLLVATPTMASCDEETIETVSSDGDLIVLSCSESFDVMAGDDVTASSWNEGEDVLLCDDARS